RPRPEPFGVAVSCATSHYARIHSHAPFSLKLNELHERRGRSAHATLIYSELRVGRSRSIAIRTSHARAHTRTRTASDRALLLVQRLAWSRGLTSAALELPCFPGRFPGVRTGARGRTLRLSDHRARGPAQASRPAPRPRAPRPRAPRVTCGF